MCTRQEIAGKLANMYDRKLAYQCQTEDDDHPETPDLPDAPEEVRLQLKRFRVDDGEDSLSTIDEDRAEQSSIEVAAVEHGSLEQGNGAEALSRVTALRLVETRT